jgi:tRNA (cytidine/uridine-2'-O-)-methyltransferase
LGFSIEDKYLKRAGLDYWNLVKVHCHENFAEVLFLYKDHNFYYNTTKSQKSYTDIQYTERDLLVFGKETAGLPEDLLAANEEHCVRIPMVNDARSLNLSNAAAIVVYEALRQQNFVNLK